MISLPENNKCMKLFLIYFCFIVVKTIGKINSKINVVIGQETLQEKPCTGLRY